MARGRSNASRSGPRAGLGAGRASARPPEAWSPTPVGAAVVNDQIAPVTGSVWPSPTSTYHS